MSVIPPVVQPHAPGATESELYGLIALISDKDAFADRLNQLVVAKGEAQAKLDEALAKERELEQREKVAAKLAADADEKAVMYHRAVEDLNEKTARFNQERNDLVAVCEKREAEAAAAVKKAAEDTAALKVITDGLEERERIASESLAQGEHLQNEYGDRLAKLKSLAGAE